MRRAAVAMAVAIVATAVLAFAAARAVALLCSVLLFGANCS